MPSSSSIRVRFAPSPTGMFHVGGARSALFNWAMARQSGGTLVLRIEDTDASRNSPEWIDGIIRALAWLGMDDEQYEGPYLQSAGADKHREAVRTLLEQGRAYYCGCTRDEVVARTGDTHKGYDGFCRDRDLGPGAGRAVRFRTPDEGKTTVVDLIRGEPIFENALLEDFVIARADGSVTFLLANAVDDMEQGITHVVRAEEHLPNAPKQQLLWDALGVTPPIWAHVPVVVNEKRQKLSKRRDKVALEDYQAEGYLAEAMRNYLMLLGWAPSGDREIVPWDEMVSEFRLENVNASPAFFDVKKLRAINGEYIRALPIERFIEECGPWLRNAPWEVDADVFAQLAPLAQTRLAVLSEITDLVDFVFLAEPVTDEASWAKGMKGPAAEILAAAEETYRDAPWEAEELKDRLERVGAVHGLKLGKTQAPVRVAVTGRTVGLPLFESLEIIGREATLARIATARTRLTAQA
jgi:glutamyl-tRNA synthetase